MSSSSESWVVAKVADGSCAFRLWFPAWIWGWVKFESRVQVSRKLQFDKIWVSQVEVHPTVIHI